MKLKDARIFLENQVQTKEKTEDGKLICKAVEVSEKKEFGNANSSTQAYSISIITRKESTIKITVPLSTKKEFEKAQTLLKKENTDFIAVTFENPVIKPFALINDAGKLCSGIYGKADGFSVLETYVVTDDFDDPEVDL